MKLLIGIVVVCASVANAALPKTWEEIVKDPKIVKTPSVAETTQQAIPATGGWEIGMVGDRFAFLFEPNGAPVVAFDLTQEWIDTKKAALGAIGIGHFSLARFWKKYKKVKESDQIEAVEMMEEEPWFEVTEADKKRGYGEFAKLEFKDAWIAKHGYAPDAKDGKRNGFKPASFSVADLYLKDKDRERVYAAMKDFARLVMDDQLAEGDLDHFLSQFKMEWDGQKEEFQIVWEPEIYFTLAGKQKRPEMPMWLLNYQQPLDILAYKYGIQNLENTVMVLETFIGDYAKIVSIFVARAVNNIKARFDAHEGQLAVMLEAAQRGEYKIDVPLLNKARFLDYTIDMIYLNKLLKTRDVTDGKRKRKEITAEEHKSIKKNIEWLKKKKYEFVLWKDQRFATVSKGSQKVGIVNLALKPKWILKQPSWVISEKHPGAKVPYRLGMEALTWAVRYFMPDSVAWGKWLSKNIGIGVTVYLPGSLWDRVLRGRIFAETGYEGHVIAHVNETLAGRFESVPGYSPLEMSSLRSQLYKQRLNPFEIPESHEAAGIQYNLNLVKKLIGEEMSGVVFAYPN